MARCSSHHQRERLTPVSASKKLKTPNYIHIKCQKSECIFSSTRYYYYIHNCIDAKYVAPMNERWFKRIMVMVPRRLKKNQAAIERIHGEIKDNYLLAVKKSTVDFVLDEPEIDADERFLDEDDETPLTIELAGE